MSSFETYELTCPYCGVTQSHELVEGNQAVTCMRGKTDVNGGGQAGCGKCYRVSVLNGRARPA